MMRMSALLAVLALASACGGADSATAPEPLPDPSRPTTIAVSPFAAELTALGETVQLAAEVRDQNGRVMAGVTVTWTSSDTSVATVDQAGLVTAVSPGTAAITASAGPASASAGITVTAPPLPDRDILVALYQATDGLNWINSENWLTDAPLREWYGVKTDAFGRVVSLDLAGKWDRVAERYVEHGLSGPIPSALGNLTSLTALHLGLNELTGPIPPELGNLTSLEELNLFVNDLTGPIPPELGRLTRLEELVLWRNDLTGPIPPELGRLTSLTRLAVSSNNLTGPIPPELGSLRRLRGLYLHSNDLSGPIPSWLGSLRRLRGLQLHSNVLSGPIPSELGNLTSLGELELNQNRLSGPIPAELGNLTSLEKLRLDDNNLSGMIPQSLLELDELNLFQFQGNAGLCAPSTAAFRTWLQGIQDVSGPFCAASSSTPNRPGPRRTYDGR